MGIHEFAQRDEAFRELLVHFRAIAGVCVKSGRQYGPFNAPCGAFVTNDMHLESWSSANRHDGLTYEELLETVRLELMAQSSAGLIAGAALLICVHREDGEEALGLQIETRQSSIAYIFPVSADGQTVDEPYVCSPFVPEGLCFFDADAQDTS